MYLCNNYFKGGILLQTIYIDVLIFINMIIDFLILDITKVILSINIKYKKVFLGSIISSLFSLLIFLPATFPILNLFINLLINIIIVLLTFGNCTVSTFIKRLICYLAVNIVFAGIIMAIFSLNKSEILIVGNGTYYFEISPVLLIILTLICYFILYFSKRILGKQLVAEKICRIVAELDGKSYFFSGKVDTGCDLREPFSNSPVIIAEKSIFNVLNLNNSCFRIVPFSSLGGNGILKAVKLDKLFIDDKPINKEVYIGFCENILKGDIKALISNEIIGDE